MGRSFPWIGCAKITRPRVLFGQRVRAFEGVHAVRCECYLVGWTFQVPFPSSRRLLARRRIGSFYAEAFAFGPALHFLLSAASGSSAGRECFVLAILNITVNIRVGCWNALSNARLFLRSAPLFAVFVERHKPLLFDAHGDGGDAPHDRDFIREAECLCLLAGIRMGNESQHTVFELTPGASIAFADIQEVDRSGQVRFTRN